VHAVAHLVAERRERSVSPVQLDRQIVERAHIRDADREAGTDEQSDEGGSLGRAVDHAQRRNEIDDLGSGKQAAEPEDPVRDAACRQSIGEPLHVLLGAEQDRARVRCAAGMRCRMLGAALVEPPGHGLGLLVDRFRGADLEIADSREGARLEGRHRDGAREGEGAHEPVRGGEDDAVVAPARHERVRAGRALRREFAGEGVHVV
jgi:hypothetical protein